MHDRAETEREPATAALGRGLAMGLADVVPGVSGGTIAMLLGIYARLITAVAALDLRTVRFAFGIFRPGGRDAFAAHARDADLWFLVRLVAGIGVGILVGAFTIGALIDSQPVPMMAVFFGLILASARIPLRWIRKPSPRTVVIIAAGALVAGAVALLPVRSGDVGLAMLFVGGILAACAMMLPGISGSALLVMMGVYPFALDAVRHARIGLVALFATGVAIGVLAASRIIRFTLQRWHDATMAVLTGFMLGSLVRVWPWRDAAGFGTGTPAAPDSLVPIAFILLGAAVSWGLERAAKGSGGGGMPAAGVDPE